MKKPVFIAIIITAALFTASCGGLFDPSTWLVSAIRADRPAYDGKDGIIGTKVIERGKFQSPEETDVVLELPAGLDEQADRWEVPPDSSFTFHAYSKARTLRWLDSRKAQFTFFVPWTLWFVYTSEATGQEACVIDGYAENYFYKNLRAGESVTLPVINFYYDTASDIYQSCSA